MKKVLALLVLIACLMSLVACGTPTIEISDDGYWVINGEKTDVKATAEETVDENPQGLQFFMQDDGTYIVSCGGARYLSNIVIPATYKGGAVVGLDRQAFSSCTTLKTITLPSSLTSIGWHAFVGCSSLTSINFEGTVQQWNAIKKDNSANGWDHLSDNYIIYCTDGQIAKDGTVTYK